MKAFLKRHGAPGNFSQLIAGLTVFLLIFHSFEPDVYELVLMVLVPVMLWNTAWLTNPWIWMIFGGFGAYAVFSDYIGTDNHKWLYMYWIFALSIAFFHSKLSDQQKIIALNARFFIVAAMGFSVFWKFMAQNWEFVNGAFMEYTFLSDDRFGTLLGWIGIAPEVYEPWYDMTLDFEFRNGFQESFAVPRKVSLLATLTTWWILFSEAAVALFFALGAYYKKVDILAHLFLMIFIVSTYLIAPVMGFGTMLCVLGLALSLARFPRTLLPYGYLLCLMVLAFYDYFF